MRNFSYDISFHITTVYDLVQETTAECGPIEGVFPIPTYPSSNVSLPLFNSRRTHMNALPPDTVPRNFRLAYVERLITEPEELVYFPGQAT